MRNWSASIHNRYVIDKSVWDQPTCNFSVESGLKYISFESNKPHRLLQSLNSAKQNWANREKWEWRSMAVATFEPGRHGVRFKKQEIQPQTKFISTNTCAGLQYTTSVQSATAVLQKTDVSWRCFARCIIRVLYYYGIQQNEERVCGKKIPCRAMLLCQHLLGWTEEKRGISQKRDLPRRNT